MSDTLRLLLALLDIAPEMERLLRAEWPRFRDEEELQPAPIPGVTLVAWQPDTTVAPTFGQNIYHSRQLERVAGDVEVATVAELTAPVERMRVVDLGTISPEAAAEEAPAPEEPGFFRRMIKTIGF